MRERGLQRRGSAIQGRPRRTSRHRLDHDRRGVTSPEAEPQLTQLHHEDTAHTQDADRRAPQEAEFAEPGGELCVAADLSDGGFLSSGERGQACYGFRRRIDVHDCCLFSGQAREPSAGRNPFGLPNG